MSDKDPRELWKKAPRGSEGDAHKDFDPVETEEDVTAQAPSDEPERYSPRHRAPGRPPLIRRRRNKEGESEEITWETPWTRSEDDSPRWSEQEASAVAPPPAPIEEVPYLGPTRAEQRKKRGRASTEEDRELVRRSRDYTGKHLAPKKGGLFGRGAPSDAEAPQPEDHDPREALAEGDIEQQQAPTAETPVPQEEATPRASEPRLESEPEVTPEAQTEVTPEAQTEVTGEDELGAQPDPTAQPEAAARPQPTAEPLLQLRTELEQLATEAATEPESSAQDPAAPTAQPTPRTEVATPVQPEPRPSKGLAAPSPAEPSALRDAEVSEDAEDDALAGPRTAALQDRKKKKRRWTAAGTIAAALVAIGGIAGAGLLVKNVVEPEKERVAVPLEQPEEEILDGTTLVFGTKEESSSGRGAIWMTLLSLDAETGKGSVVYIPPHTAVEVPGRGLQGVGEAYGSGGVPLLLVSTENLLGVKIDRYLELSDKDALVFFENLDAMTVDVPAEVRVPVGEDQARLIFVEGPQELSPSLLVKLLYIVGIDGDDVELGSRHLAFWDELLNVYADGSELATAVEGAGAALGESDASAEEHAEFFSALADLPTEDLTITALPVRPISAGESELYATDEAELVSFVEETIGIDQERPQEIRIQVLNGNGVPGIGQEVADQLVGEGFRVILSGNARRLNYRKTLVIAYDNSEEGIALAERARDLLGVGEVQVSAQQQGIVDLTIVVGKDFLRAR